jgi:hydrogenase maturation protease
MTNAARAESAGIVVLGVGNSIRTDDGLGIHALERLRKHPALPADVELVEGGTKGLELACYAAEASKLLILDAVDVGEAPGTVVRFSGADLANLPGGKSIHELGLADLLLTLSLVAEQPQEIIVMGVQPDVIEWGTELSPVVEAALEPLMEAAMEQLTSWAETPRKFEAAVSAVPVGSSAERTGSENTKEAR